MITHPLVLDSADPGSLEICTIPGLTISVFYLADINCTKRGDMVPSDGMVSAVHPCRNRLLRGLVRGTNTWDQQERLSMEVVNGTSLTRHPHERISRCRDRNSAIVITGSHVLAPKLNNVVLRSEFHTVDMWCSYRYYLISIRVARQKNRQVWMFCTRYHVFPIRINVYFEGVGKVLGSNE